MDLQSYLRGLGVGIAVTTIILMVSFAVSNKEPDTEEIIERARALGMVESTAFMLPTEETSESVTTSAAEEPATKEPETETVTEPATEAVTEPATEAVTEDTTEPVVSGEQIIVDVQNFKQAYVAAQILQEAGVVDNADDFTEFMIENGYTTRLFEGTYTFTKGMSYDQIAKIICRME